MPSRWLTECSWLVERSTPELHWLHFLSLRPRLSITTCVMSTPPRLVSIIPEMTQRSRLSRHSKCNCAFQIKIGLPSAKHFNVFRINQGCHMYRCFTTIPETATDWVTLRENWNSGRCDSSSCWLLHGDRGCWQINLPPDHCLSV